MVDWSTIPKIDAHIHLMPPDVIEANQGCGDKFADFGSVSDYQRLMERYHIKAAVIMPFNDPYMLSMDFNISSVHDNLLSMCTGGRLFCFADIDVRNSAAETLRELERVMQERAVLGVKIHPSNIGYPVDGAYFRPIFAWAAANGIVNGVGGNKFAPSEPVTREQLAAIFFRYAKAEAPEADVLSGYPDAESVSTYARDAMAWAVSTGLVTGSKEADGTYLAPQGLAAREQAAAILMRYVKANA